MVGGYTYTVYNKGYDDSSDKHAKDQAKFDKDVADLIAKNERESNRKLFKIIEEKERLDEELNVAFGKLDNRRMFVPTKPGSCVSKTEDPVESSGGTLSIELPESFAKEIRHDYFSAQRVVNQYNACRKELMSIADVID